MNGLFHGIELKGSCRKGDTSATFTFKSIRLQDTNWKHLLLVGRVRDPTSWLSIEDVESHVVAVEHHRVPPGAFCATGTSASSAVHTAANLTITASEVLSISARSSLDLVV